MCGWTKDNSDLRVSFIRAIDADVITVCETHLAENNVIEVDGYTWYGYNRTVIHRKAPKPSGGVGLLVRKGIFDQYDVVVVDRSYEGIIAIKFTHRITSANFVVFSCYLPPENSPRGRDAQSFFAHLLSVKSEFWKQLRMRK